MSLRRILLISIVIILAVLLVGPFLIPVPPLTDTLPAEQLADSDSRFIEIEGLRVHYKTAGVGEPTLILLHGFGSSLFSWREVMAPLTGLGTVFAYDRPAFGLTERPLKWQGLNPYSSVYQPQLLIRMMDALHVEKAILIGNSAGGSIAMQTALLYPQRVIALVLVDAAVYEGGSNPITHLLYQTPQTSHLGILLARNIKTWGMDMLQTAWHDPTKITPDVMAGYTKPLQAKNWDRALWEIFRAGQPGDLANHLNGSTLPLLIITGDDDHIVPTEHSILLAREIPNAELSIIPNCGHVPHEECPQAFLKTTVDFLKGLQ
jgi:pimeloyl-ACP methyl ester carboxylesterase